MEVLPLELGQEPHHAILEHLGAEAADGWMRSRLRGQMLAGAEADLEPEIGDPLRKQARGVERATLRRLEADRRQSFGQQALLAGS